MANTIALAEKYLPLLDEVYKRESLTSILDTQDVRFEGANKVQVFEIGMNGLGNYSRDNGFTTGAVTGEWKDYTLARDRARSFTIDTMDNEETLGMSFGKLAGEFLRTMVVPEIDSYRFATYAGTAGIGAASAADFGSSAHDVAGAIDTAEQTMNDEEVPVEGRILYVSENTYKYLKGDISRTLANEGNVTREIETFDNMRVIRVPKSRFSTKITLYDGTTSGQEAGGFIQTASTGYPINFMIVHPSAVIQLAKHVKPRIFSPDVNQQADAYKFDYRIYHDAFVRNKKLKGIYLHRASTANS